jgi:toxin FitB
VIVLDTNVLSELARQDPEPRVIAWLDSQDPAEVCTTSITAAELFDGIARLPSGSRTTQLAQSINDLLEQDLESRVMAFGLAAARHYALVVSEREKADRPIAGADGQIAAICRELQATLATRNVKDFENTGVRLVNPWLT